MQPHQQGILEERPKLTSTWWSPSHFWQPQFKCINSSTISWFQRIPPIYHFVRKKYLVINHAYWDLLSAQECHFVLLLLSSNTAQWLRAMESELGTDCRSRCLGKGLVVIANCLIHVWTEETGCMFVVRYCRHKLLMLHEINSTSTTRQAFNN